MVKSGMKRVNSASLSFLFKCKSIVLKFPAKMGQQSVPLCVFTRESDLFLFHFHHCRFAYCTRDQVGLGLENPIMRT